ncbi:MAG: hypothetical protein HXS44_04800 [Theionarchaea archaeon]|nr:hypothetical protein [Theionarchaea archaeon]
MEKTENEHFKDEIYGARIDSWMVAGLTFLGTVILGFLLYWITHPGRSMFFQVSVIISVAGLLLLLFITEVIRRTQIILTRDAFTQTVVKGVIPWEAIDHVEYYPGEHRKGLAIYYRRDNQIKKFGTSYANIEGREQFIESLREFSRVYGFAIREK